MDKWIVSSLPLLLILPALAMSRAAHAANKADFYVAVNGNDGWSGTLAAPNAAKTDGPFATLARAQEAVRQIKGKATGPITVAVRGGTYTLTTPLRFSPADSGTAAAPITYEAYPGEAPVFSGGADIHGWEKDQGHIWTAEIPDVKAGKWYFHQLFVDGNRRTRARTPNEGYFHIAGTVQPFTDRQKNRGDNTYKEGFKYQPGDIQHWPDLDDAMIVLYHSWTASLHWIKELDEQNRVVHFTNRCGWPVGYWDPKQRYYIENYREALDSPGEWYLDRKTGVLSYWPMDGEDLTTATVVAPRLQHLLEIAGEPELGLAVEHLRFRGLSFQHADWKVKHDEMAGGQAAIHLSAAVVASGARDCTFENCEIAHVGEYAVILGDGCKENRIVHCHIHDLGGGGVRIGTTDLPAEPERQADHNTVDNCFIHDGGHVFRAGIGVWIGKSSYNTVSHNEICDFDYSGCSVGWSWGYAPSSANHNIFEFNHIHDLGKGVLSDMGGIYSLGISPGTIERNNVIHDVYSYSYGGWGLYTDEGSSDILLENNIVYNTKSGGFHQHYGRENILRNNIFAFSWDGEIIRTRAEDHISFTFDHNIVVTDNDQPLGSNWSGSNYKLDDNVYWDTKSPDDADSLAVRLEFAGMDFKEWQAAGHDKHSVIADPLFVDIAHHDFHLKDGSPALKLGFRQIDTSKVGLYGDPAWVNAPRNIVRQPIESDFLVRVERPQPNDHIADDFEGTAVGDSPAGAAVSGEEKGASIRVTDETAASGKHSLKFTDAAGLSHDWQPHMYYQPTITRGVIHCTYDVRVEKGAIFWNDWRDASNPYKVGPAVRIEADGELKAGEKTLLTVPPGQWIHLDFTCPVGRTATGTYDLAVTLPGKALQTFKDLPFGTKEFRSLRWFGFISLATEKAVFYIDNLKLERVGK